MAAWAFQGVLNVGIQILLLVFSGWCFPRFGLLSADQFMNQINVLILRVGFPSLTITLLGMKVDLRDGEVWRSLAAHAVWVTLVQGVIVLYKWLRPSQGPRDAALLNLVLTANNTIIVGLPVMEATFPKEGSRLSLLSALPLFLQCIPFSITAFEMERAALADREHNAAAAATAAAVQEPPSTPQRELSGRWEAEEGGTDGGGGEGGVRHRAASDEGGDGDSDGVYGNGTREARWEGEDEKKDSAMRDRVAGQAWALGKGATAARKGRVSRRHRVASDAATCGAVETDGSSPETPRGSDISVGHVSSECTTTEKAASAAAVVHTAALALTHGSVGPVALPLPTPGSASTPSLDRQSIAHCPTSSEHPPAAEMPFSDCTATALPQPSPALVPTTQTAPLHKAPATASYDGALRARAPAADCSESTTKSSRPRAGHIDGFKTVARRRGSDPVASTVREPRGAQGRGTMGHARRSNPGVMIHTGQPQVQPQQRTRNANIQRYSMPVNWPPIMFVLDATSSPWVAAPTGNGGGNGVSYGNGITVTLASQPSPPLSTRLFSPFATANPDRSISHAVRPPVCMSVDRPSASIKSGNAAIVRASAGAMYDSTTGVIGSGAVLPLSYTACAAVGEAPPSISAMLDAKCDRAIVRAATSDMIRRRGGVWVVSWGWFRNQVRHLVRSRGWLIAWIVMKNPMLWSLLVALIINLSGLRLVLLPGAVHYRPELGWVYGTLSWASGITVPVSLFSNGVWLYGKRFGAATMKRACVILAVKLLLLGPLQLALAGACGLGAEAAMSLLLLVLCPVASASFVIASQYGHGGDIVTAVTVLGIVLLVPAALIALAVPRALGLYTYDVHRIS
uniref:Uncharacterized protein n=1 Tax=Volvox ferrisii TaxID=1075618 RepID=A0A075M2R3_9CHLO|nr:hypothetical protein [Volvox ferrisii]